MNDDFGPAHSVRIVHFDDSSFDLAVVFVDPRMLARIPDALLKIIKISPAAIGGIEIELDFEMFGKRLADPPRELRAHLSAILAAFAAEERAVTDMAIIPVHTRRERQHKS